MKLSTETLFWLFRRPAYYRTGTPGGDTCYENDKDPAIDERLKTNKKVLPVGSCQRNYLVLKKKKKVVSIFASSCQNFGS